MPSLPPGTLDRPFEPVAREQTVAELRESEARYRALFDSIDEGFCVIEVLFDDEGRPADYRFLETNAAFAEQSGLTDVVGKRIRELNPGHEERRFRIYGDVALTGVPTRYTDEVRGLGRWFDAYAFPFGAAGSMRVAVLFHDVSERKRTEGALREAAERDAYRVALTDALRQYGDAVAIQVVAAQLLGRHLAANRVHYAEMEEDGVHVTVHRDYCDGVVGVAGRHRVSDYGATLLAECHAGRTFVVRDTAASTLLTPGEQAALTAIQTGAYVAVPLMEGKRLAAIIAVHQAEPRAWTVDEVALIEETAERTWSSVERIRAEAALRLLNETLEGRVAERTAELKASEDRFRSLFASSPVGIVMTDMEGRVVEANPAFHHMLGYGVGSLRGQFGTDLTLPEDRGQTEAYYAAILAGQIDGFDIEKRYVGNDGTTPWAHVTASAVRDEAGTPQFIIASIQDVTERRGLARAAEEAAETERRRLSYELHDDVAQRLTGASVLAHTLESDLLSSGHGGAAMAGRLGTLVRDTMRHVRALSRALAPVDLLAEGLAEALERLGRSTTEAYGVRCGVEVGADALVVEPAVATHLFRIAQEAVSNAARHAGAEEILIGFTRGEGALHLSVQDDGQGLPSGTIASSQGLGLRTMRSRAAALGGVLTIESLPGSGTTVTCTVPSAA